VWACLQGSEGEKERKREREREIECGRAEFLVFMFARVRTPMDKLPGTPSLLVRERERERERERCRIWLLNLRLKRNDKCLALARLSCLVFYSVH
jgi:hypothetical protein